MTGADLWIRVDFVSTDPVPFPSGFVMKLSYHYLLIVFSSSSSCRHSTEIFPHPSPSFLSAPLLPDLSPVNPKPDERIVFEQLAVRTKNAFPVMSEETLDFLPEAL
jgi:hypothetical protein